MTRRGLVSALLLLLPALLFDLALPLIYPPAAPLLPASALAVAALAAGCYPRALSPLVAAFGLGLVLDALTARFFLQHTVLLVVAVGAGFLLAPPERRRNPLVAATALTLLALTFLLAELVLVSLLGYGGFLGRFASVEWWWLLVFFVLVLATWVGISEVARREVLGEGLI